ncbi:MAG: hypothetical protein QNJ27_01290 [Simkaniaceae bacterium]|nr:hypothetical protein [Simkaniaceae bacterium]
MDPNKIKGNLQRPYNTPEEKRSSNKIDPEKFKKVMKVDESDETQKRKKRNLPKEEGSDEEVQGQTPALNPVTSFSEFMSGKEELGNVFDKESAGTRRQVDSQEEATDTVPPSGSISTDPSSAALSQPQSQTGQEQTTSSEQTQPLQKADKETLDAGIQEGPTKDPSFFKRFSAEEARSQKMGEEKQATAIEGSFVPPSSEGEQGKMEGREKKDEGFFVEAGSQTAGIPLPTFENPLPAIVTPTDIPSYAKLSPEVYELFEKMGGVMTVQQDKGITTTTMTMNMPGSVFDGTQVILNQYSTAPNAFNIQLVGHPDSVKIFTQNLDALRESFRQANFTFETNILTPILTTSKKSPHLIRRAESAGDQDKQGDKRGG